MEIKQINQIMVSMGRYGIKRVSIEREGVKVEIEREGAASKIKNDQELVGEDNPLRVDFERHKVLGPVRSEVTFETIDGIGDERVAFVTSPMVGTIYLASSPKDAPLIKVGDVVDENTVVCIVEAMKVMNEVKAGVSGVVQEILVENISPVEFGTRLMRVVPN